MTVLLFILTFKLTRWLNEKRLMVQSENIDQKLDNQNCDIE